MSPGSSTESYPAFAHIGLRENPGKNLNQVTCPDRESNPGHLLSRSDVLTVTPQIWRVAVNILNKQSRTADEGWSSSLGVWGLLRILTGEWRKLHNTELHALYSSPDIIRNIKSRRLRCAGHVARLGESRNPYRVLDGRPEGKRPLGSRPGWRVGIALAFYAQGCGFDPGPGRWHLSVI
ncbi:hypothetical protein ANN_07872 [Periplaneta americana]|uniref:Uncharacterized protein n=1 Tax=Periplaneta americana TaxID=6978 RepID=A0ABQ8T101_PERAM|nr:hypothetical protein ANN_07872 [Periplaneta americana]